jgi:hypothetical protein
VNGASCLLIVTVDPISGNRPTHAAVKIWFSVAKSKKPSRAGLAPREDRRRQHAASPKASTAVRGMDAVVRASRWKRPTVLFDELQKIVENLQDIVENSEDIITVPHPGSLMYARSWKSHVDRRESATLSIP